MCNDAAVIMAASTHSLDFNGTRNFGRSTSQPEHRHLPPHPNVDSDFSDDEDSLDVAAAVAKLTMPDGATPEDSAQKKRPGSDGAMAPVDTSLRGTFSSVSTPDLNSCATHSNNHTDAVAAEQQQDPKAAVSWKDIEHFCQKLDAECGEVRIESFDLSCMEEDVELPAVSPKTLADLKALESSDSPASSFVERVQHTDVQEPSPLNHEEDYEEISDISKAVFGVPGTTQAAMEAKSRTGSEAKPPVNPSRKKRPDSVDLGYSSAAAVATEVSYSFASPSPSPSTKSMSPAPSPSTPGPHDFPLSISPGCSGPLSLSSGKTSPSTSGLLPLLGSKGSSPSPSFPSSSSSQALPAAIKATVSVSRSSMSSATPFHMAPMGALLPMGGDIIGTAAKPMPSFNPQPLQLTTGPGGPHRQVSCAWPPGKQEIQPAPFQNPGGVVVPLAAQQPSRQAQDKEAQRKLDLELFELNSRPTRSSSMVVPGATAARPAVKPSGSKGFLGGLKAKCGELFSSSKKNKGRA